MAQNLKPDTVTLPNLGTISAENAAGTGTIVIGYIDASGNLVLGGGSGFNFILVNGSVIPSVDATDNLGRSGNAFASGTINNLSALQINLPNNGPLNAKLANGTVVNMLYVDPSGDFVMGSGTSLALLSATGGLVPSADNVQALGRSGNRFATGYVVLLTAEQQIFKPGTRPSSPATGLTIFNSGTSKIETWDGTAWQPHW